MSAKTSAISDGQVARAMGCRAGAVPGAIPAVMNDLHDPPKIVRCGDRADEQTVLDCAKALRTSSQQLEPTRKHFAHSYYPPCGPVS
jgi:hypothetical protein